MLDVKFNYNTQSHHQVFVAIRFKGKTSCVI